MNVRPQVSVLACVKCGAALGLPEDPRVLHIDCPHCGTDNILATDLIEARRQQYELDLEQRAQALAATRERALARGRIIRTVLVILAGMAVMAVVAAFALYAYLGERALAEAAADPARNGNAAVLATLDEMRRTQKCDRLLHQPAVHTGAAATVALAMVENEHCVHILAASGDGSPLTMQYDTPQAALRVPIPPAGPRLDYRLCASVTQEHAFRVEAAEKTPFTVAAIECPRTVAEGAPRSRADDPKSTGIDVVKKKMALLYKAGCKYVVAQPAAHQGAQTVTFTSQAKASCLNALVASAFSDVRFTTSLIDPNDHVLPVPEPASDVRVLYCPEVEGKYKLTVTPSTRDHFAITTIDCPRNGPEGLRRAQALRKPR